jgi:septum formation protein
MNNAAGIYLASRSPRRQELLRQIGVHFHELRFREAPARSSDVVERPKARERALEYVQRISRTKATVGWDCMLMRRLPEKPVLAADTEVVLDGKVLGKPTDGSHAVAMLEALSGRTHEVATAVAVRGADDTLTALNVSQVSFRELARHEIERYVASGESFDKAGAYAIQGRAAMFITRIEGSYSAVMGLPLYETARILGEIGYPVL